jgi:hypothetical protein
MGYWNQNNRYQNTRDLTLVPATTFAAAGAANGAAFEIGERVSGNFELAVTALSASDTIDAKIQTSKDGTGSGAGAWRDVASFTQVTAAPSTERKSFSGLDRFIRAVVTPTDAGGGGVSATLSVTGELK